MTTEEAIDLTDAEILARLSKGEPVKFTPGKAVPKCQKDPLNPDYYKSGSIETIDFIEDKQLGFHLGNCVKYIVRAGKKDQSKEIEDLEKARWYLDRWIQKRKEELNAKINS